MPRWRTLAAGSFAIALAGTMLCAVSFSAAQRRAAVRVAVGEIGGDEGREALVTALGEALEQNPDVTPSARRGAELVLDGSVVRWERQPVPDGLEVRCEVSLIVSDARGGAVRAMLRGRGGARGGTGAERLSQDALRAAVRGALRPLGQTGRSLARAR